MSFAIFITQRAGRCLHTVGLCLNLIGIKYVGLVSHWLTPISGCHSLASTLLLN